MSIEFIDLIETNPMDPEWPRSSSLARTDREPNAFRTVGVLPHGYGYFGQLLRGCAVKVHMSLGNHGVKAYGS